MKFSKTLLFLLCIIVCVSCTSCLTAQFVYRIREKHYYSDKSNFAAVMATCVTLTTNEHFPGRYYIVVDDMVYEKDDQCRFVDNCFEVEESNATILKEAEIEEKLIPGTTFTFYSAPEYFGDGYWCPLVGLEINGEVLLDFDTGYKNLMATYGVYIE